MRNANKIRWFSKKTERILGSEELVAELKKLKKILSYDDEYDFLHGWTNLDKKTVSQIQPFCKHKIDLDKYDYQVGSCLVE